MKRPWNLRRRFALFGVLVLVAGLCATPASAQSYVPPTWSPPAGHNVTTVKWGPITIPAAQNGQPGHLENEIAIDGLCNPLVGLFTSCRRMEIEKPFDGDGYITGILPDLVFAGTDTSVNFNTGGMLHHAVNVNFSRPDPTCRPGIGNLINLVGLLQGGNERFFAAGNERTLNRLYQTGDYGYFVRGSDRWGLIYHLMNMRPEPITVEFKYTFSWVRASTRVDPVWLDVDQCGDSEVSIPAGYSDLHATTTARRSGTLIAVGGHAHDRSLSVSLENATKGRYSCTSVAGYGPDSPFAPTGPGAGTPGHPASANIVTSTGNPSAPLEVYRGHLADFTTCEQQVAFDRGDRIRIHAQYHTPAADDAMGIMVAYVRWR